MWNVCKRPVFASGMIIAALIASDHTRAWSQTIPPIPKSTNPKKHLPCGRSLAPSNSGTGQSPSTEGAGLSVLSGGMAAFSLRNAAGQGRHRAPSVLVVCHPRKFVGPQFAPLFPPSATGILSVAPRVAKRPDAFTLSPGRPVLGSGIHQAGLSDILVDQQGHPVYYAIHVNPSFSAFLLQNHLTTAEALKNADPELAFPTGVAEFKSAWQIVETPPPSVLHPLLRPAPASQNSKRSTERLKNCRASSVRSHLLSSRFMSFLS